MTEDQVINNYELGYLLTPLLAEDKVGESVERVLRTPIVAAGGELKREDVPKLIPLAYPIKKVVEHKGTIFRDAYFGTLHFSLASAELPAVAHKLKQSAEVIRLLLVVAESNWSRPEVKRPARAKSVPVPVVPIEPKGAMSAEAIDQEIDNLIHVS